MKNYVFEISRKSMVVVFADDDETAVEIAMQEPIYPDECEIVVKEPTQQTQPNERD